MLKNDKLQMVLFCLAHAVVFLPLFNTVYRLPHPSTPAYLAFASGIMSGHVPYLDFPLEYPPFSLFFFLLPRLFSSSLSGFAGVYEAEILIFDLVGMYILYRMAKNNGIAPWKALMIYSLAVMAIGPLLIESYDLFPAVLTLISLYFFTTGKHKTSWFFLALGVMTKLYPAVIAPIYLLYYLPDRRYKEMLTGIGVAAATCMIIALPFLILTPKGFWGLTSFHGGRPLQVETTYSSVLLVHDRVTGTAPQIIYGSGSYNLIGPVPDRLAKISPYVMVILLIAAYWLMYLRIKKGKLQVADIVICSLLVILVLLISGKVLSPQYFIWLLPLLALIPGKKGLTTAGFFIIIGVLTYYVYPWHYEQLKDITDPAAIVLLARNLLLVSLTAVIAVFMYQTNQKKKVFLHPKEA